MDTGLVILRLVIGPLMAAHGAQKLFGWFGGYGLNGTGGFFEQLGFRPGRLFAGAAGAAELASGTLVTLGLFGPVGPALMISVMVVAAVSVSGRLRSSRPSSTLPWSASQSRTRTSAGTPTQIATKAPW